VDRDGVSGGTHDLGELARVHRHRRGDAGGVRELLRRDHFESIGRGGFRCSLRSLGLCLSPVAPHSQSHEHGECDRDQFKLGMRAHVLIDAEHPVPRRDVVGG